MHRFPILFKHDRNAMIARLFKNINSAGLVVIVLASLPGPVQDPARLSPSTNGVAAITNLTTQQDHRLMMELLGIKSLRPGANPNNPNATNAVNYDEAKANPYPTLPDPLVLKNGKRVTTSDM